MSSYREIPAGGYASPVAVSTQDDTVLSSQQAGTSIKPVRSGSPDMTEIQFEEIFISFPKGDIDAAETAKELIEMQIKKLKKASSPE